MRAYLKNTYFDAASKLEVIDLIGKRLKMRQLIESLECV